MTEQRIILNAPAKINLTLEVLKNARTAITIFEPSCTASMFAIR